MTYNLPIRFFYKGDKKVALRYVRDARRLVAAYIATLGRAASGRRIFPIKNVGEIDIVVAGPNNITVVIDVGGGGKKARWFEDFVPFSGQSAFVNGELVYYPLIVKPDQRGGWVTYFRDVDAPGYRTAPDPKGTYFDVFPKTQLGVTEGSMYLPMGSLNYRNQRGEYISWTGNATQACMAQRYRTQYSRYEQVVYHQGHVLLNAAQQKIDAGDTAVNDSYVMGAGLYNNFLYTVQSEMLFDTTYPVAPTPAPRRSVWTSPQFLGGNFVVSVRRYSIYPKIDERTGVYHYAVAPGSMEILWTGTLARAYAGWHFNDDCTEVVSFQIPNQTIVSFSEGEKVPSSGLSSSHLRMSFQIDHDAGTATYSQSTQTTLIAEQSGNTLELVRVGRGYDYIIGGVSIEAIRWGDTGYSAAKIMYMDLRNNWLVLQKDTYTYASDDVLNVVTEAAIYHNGSKEVIFTGNNTIAQGGKGLTYAQAWRDAFDTMYSGAPSSLAVAYAELYGVIKDEFDDNDTPDDITDDNDVFLATLGNPLNLTPFAVGTKGTSYGGGKFSQAPSSAYPNWGQWTGVLGFDGFNNPDPYAYVQPTVYYTRTGGASTSENILAGFAFNVPGVGLFNRNYITGANLNTISGGAFNNTDRVAIQCSILGRPPVAQKIDY